MPDKPQFYGHYVFTHGWGRVLTVMSPAGAATVRKVVRVGDDIAVTGGDGRLTQYHEKRKGALDRLIETNDIVIVNKAEWDALKSEFGAAIYR